MRATRPVAGDPLTVTPRADDTRSCAKALEILVIMCVHACMSIHTSPRNPAGLLRRRVIVEFTPEQLALLDQAEARHGTKRAGIVAALAAYATPTPSDGEAGRSSARAKADKAQAAKLRVAEDDPGAAQTELSSLRTARAKAEAKASELREQLEHADRVRIAIEDAWASKAAQLNELIDTLRTQIPDAAYCARCGKWVPEPEWAWTDDGARGEYAYHTRCGDHGSGIVVAASLLVRRSA